MMKYLSVEHLAELRASGLTDETIALANLETERDQLRVHEYLNWPPPKRWAKNQLGDCLIFPCYLPGAEEPYARRVKPTHPRTERKKGKAKERKYESPKGSSSVIYYPPRSRKKLSTTATKLWVEGEKKALLLDQLGYAAIGLPGVSNAHCSATRRESGEWRLHPLIDGNVQVAGCEHIVAFDSDARQKQDVHRAALILARMLIDAGATAVKIALPPDGPASEKLGVDDYYALIERRGENGAHAIAKLFETAEELDPNNLDMRPRIVLGVDEHRCIDEASAVLPHVDAFYVQGRHLVRVDIAERETSRRGIRRTVGTPVIEALPAPSLRETLTRQAQIIRIVEVDGQDVEQPAHPPEWLVSGLHARGCWPGMREITGVVEAPLLRPDGSVLAESGYDEETGLLVLLSPELESIEIDDAPTHEQAEDAAVLLLDLVEDFPFSTPADRAAWLAGVITAFARSAFEGPSPLFLIDAAAKRTGKTLLATVTGAIVLGREPGTAGYVHDDAEMSKRITSIAKSGLGFTLLDNIKGPFGCASLDRALTTTIWRERLLGTNSEPEFPLRCTWFGTSNNAQFVADTDGRTVPIRLVSPLEHPESRTGFRHNNIIKHTLARRAQYVAAILTILRAYVAAGRPLQKIGTLGAFEGWVALVAAAVHWTTGIDPLDSRQHLVTSGDPELEALRALCEGLVHLGAIGTGQRLLARNILERLDKPELPPALAGAKEALEELVRHRPGTPITPRALGMALKSFLDRAVSTSAGTVRLKSLTYIGTLYWFLEYVDQRADKSDGTYGTNGAPPSASGYGFANGRASCTANPDAPAPPPSVPLVPSDEPGCELEYATDAQELVV